MFLIVSCSQLKSELTHGKARDIYTGALFLKCVEYCKQNKMKLFIISSKYGLINWNTVINTYDERLAKPYNGKWPRGKGLFVGSRKKNFTNVPDRIAPLMPEVETNYNFGYGCQLRRMNELLK